MKLNEQLSGLPEWPPIVQEAEGYVVGGPHVSYKRYKVARLLGIFLVLGYTLAALCLGGGIGVMLKSSGTMDLVICAIFLVPLLIFIGFFPASRLLCQWCFPCRTLVRFTPRHIIVDKKTFENIPQGQVQFRASESYLEEGDYYDRIIEKKQRGQLVEALAYELKFRKIEMIYGSRIVPITSLADEKRAAQFAIALQHGYELAGQRKTAPSSKTAIKDDLPE